MSTKSDEKEGFSLASYPISSAKMQPVITSSLNDPETQSNIN
jgi:hypothetical protein